MMTLKRSCRSMARPHTRSTHTQTGPSDTPRAASRPWVPTQPTTKHPGTLQHDITSDEALASKFCLDIDGALHLHSPLQGALTSSNRAEAAALLLALMGPVPLNVGVDNALAVSTANRIIHGLQTKYRKPWELQPNGDIWANFKNTLDEAGQGATKVTKLKGHATQQHIDDKVISAEDKAGNDIADQLADEAHEGFPKHQRELANLYVHRTNHYRELEHVIQLTMTRVIEAMQQRKASLALFNHLMLLLTSKETKRRQCYSNASLIQTPNGQKTAEFAKIREVDCVNLARKWPHYDFLNKAKVFLATLAIAQPNNNDHGISWLELGMLFEHRTGTAIPNDLGTDKTPKTCSPNPDRSRESANTSPQHAGALLKWYLGASRVNNSG